MSPDRDLSGTLIAGRYRVERRLGIGGMGTVWRVRHVESLQRYALKTLHATTARDRMSVERFLREARAAAALNSKYVVKIVDAQMGHVDSITQEPMPFLVMELLTGSNLGQILEAKGPLGRDQLVWVLQQVGRALDLAHGKGIVHRDLKPENIFIALDEDGEPVTKVCDFGIAKVGSGEGSIDSTGALGTETGATIGTPLYMAPEQARNSASVVPATDQWAIALIAFRALTTREYFAGAHSTADLLLRIVNDPLILPSTRLSTLPRAFDDWFVRSCDREPSKRWSSVGAQVQALGASLSVTDPRPPGVVPSVELLANAVTVRAREGDDAGDSAGGSDARHARERGALGDGSEVDRARTRTAVETTNAPASRSARASTSSVSDPSSSAERLVAGETRSRLKSRAVPIGIGAGVALLCVAIGLGVNAANRDAATTTAPSVSPRISADPTAIDRPLASTQSPSASVSVSAGGGVSVGAKSTGSIAGDATAPVGTAKHPSLAIPSNTPIGAITANAPNAASGKPSTAASIAPSTLPPSKLAAGASCERNAECASLICAAFQCQ